MSWPGKTGPPRGTWHSPFARIEFLRSADNLACPLLGGPVLPGHDNLYLTSPPQAFVSLIYPSIGRKLTQRWHWPQLSDPAQADPAFCHRRIVLLSSLAVGVCATWLTLRSTQALMNLTEKAAVSTATDEIQNFFKPVPEITADLAADARNGLLPMDDPHLLARQLADRLRVREQLLWIGYADARSGLYVGATRREDGEIIEYVADPAVNGGVPNR